MIRYDHLLNRKFEFGFVDCYALIRDFYTDNFGIDLPNYARPRGFWDAGMDMYMDRFRKNGFYVLDCHPSEFQVGDVAIISIRTSIGNHAAILVENNQILHHFTGRLSTVESYRGLWRNNTIAILRHKDVVLDTTSHEASLIDLLPPNVQRKVNAAIRDREASS